jgi:hypothetical protein
MTSITDATTRSHSGKREFCAERRLLLLRYTEAISAVNQALAKELCLPASERLGMRAALRQKEWIKVELYFHEQSHGCGVRCSGRLEIVHDLSSMPVSPPPPIGDDQDWTLHDTVSHECGAVRLLRKPGPIDKSGAARPATSSVSSSTPSCRGMFLLLPALTRQLRLPG